MESLESRVILILCTVFFVIGLSHSVGFLLKHEQMFYFGKATAFSPLPVPFSDSFKFEHFSSHREFIILTKEGSEVREIPSRTIKETLLGPHRRTVVFMTAADGAPLYAPLLNEHILREMFCTDSVVVISERVSPENRVRVILRTTEGAEGREGRVHERTVSCI